MNAIMLLTPKSEVEYLLDSCTLRQALEKMKGHSYSAIPVLSKDGRYIGCVSEGDFLWHIVDSSKLGTVIDKCENYKLKDIIVPERVQAVTVNVSMETLIDRAQRQNFVPVTDDRGNFIGIVTRRRIIETFCDVNNARKVRV